MTDFLGELEVRESAQDVCPEWTTNQADLHGPNVASARSVLRLVIDFVIPTGILVFYLIFWILLTLRYEENTRYFLKRTLLSFLVVVFLTYVSITKTAVNTLQCIKIHDFIDFDDQTGEYWALDTSLKCYKGSYAVLASTAGWPVLAIFFFGLPAILAYALIRQRFQEPGQNLWFSDATGFLYRANEELFINWESIVMLRIAFPTVIVAYSYPLGTNNQGILAICVLAFAIYVHVTCQPFDEPYHSLNAFEKASLFVSQLAFASGLFFNDERTSGVVKVLLSLLLSAAICGLFLVLSFAFVKSAVDYLKTVLEEQGMEDVQGWGILRLLRTFLFMRVAGCATGLCRICDGGYSDHPDATPSD